MDINDEASFGLRQAAITDPRDRRKSSETIASPIPRDAPTTTEQPSGFANLADNLVATCMCMVRSTVLYFFYLSRGTGTR